MKKITPFFVCILLVMVSCKAEKPSGLHSISKTVLMDKIMGGWVGQVIGCTYGGPTEFKWNGTMIGDHVPIPWDDSRMKWYFDHFPGLYDDVYMDLTFMKVIESHGIDAADSLHALAFAHADYPLWHANQAARYNILNGIMPPESGHWKNNPHADDIDFQIEADFAGLMSPGMVNAATELSWRIGHIMNYGDGVYGGIFVAAMYALAFVHDDIAFVVEEALKSIPPQSDYRMCIEEVIRQYRDDPNDWKKAWFEVQKRWTKVIGCPDGVFSTYNIEAKTNGAYIVIGLLYGKGDYGATIDISTRCGDDSDCNPANAAGILGTMIGFSRIPDYWKQGLDKVDDLNFAYTGMSLKEVYETGFRHSLQMIERNGGRIEGDQVVIQSQTPVTMPFEKSFDGFYPVERSRMDGSLTNENSEIHFNFKGSGFILTGRAVKTTSYPDEILVCEVYVNGELFETANIPTNDLIRRHEITWCYDLAEGDNQITLRAKDIPEGYSINTHELITYSQKTEDQE